MTYTTRMQIPSSSVNWKEVSWPLPTFRLLPWDHRLYTKDHDEENLSKEFFSFSFSKKKINDKIQNNEYYWNSTYVFSKFVPILQHSPACFWETPRPRIFRSAFQKRFPRRRRFPLRDLNQREKDEIFQQLNRLVVTLPTHEKRK